MAKAVGRVLWTPTLASTRPERLKRALGYPYTRPPSSYVLIRQTPYCFEDRAWTGAADFEGLNVRKLDSGSPSDSGWLRANDAIENEGVSWTSGGGEGWTPVLAIGSNAAHSQLCRKYPSNIFPDGVIIPVVRSVLHDFDVCYAPIITSYGSVAATLHPSEGTAVELYVTYLDDKALEHMHKTEGAYDLQELSGINLEVGTSQEAQMRGLEPAMKLSSVLVYVHQQGAVRLPCRGDQQPVALSEINAQRRRFPHLPQTGLQSAIRLCLGDHAADAMAGLKDLPIWPAGELPEDETPKDSDALHNWVLRNIEDEDVRRAYLPRLAATAELFQFLGAQKLSSLGDMYSANVK